MQSFDGYRAEMLENYSKTVRFGIFASKNHIAAVRAAQERVIIKRWGRRMAASKFNN